LPFHPSSCDFNTGIEAHLFEPIETLLLLSVSQSDSQNVVVVRLESQRMAKLKFHAAATAFAL
jgi:hypothetical protein